MKSYLLPALTVGILAASVGQAQAISIILDDFSTSSINTSTRTSNFGVNNSNLSTSNTTGSGILGNRFTSVRATHGNTGTSAVLRTQGCSNISGQCMSYSAASGVRGPFSLKYDFSSTDLTAGGSNDVIRLGLAAADFSTTLSTTVKDALNNTFTFAPTTTPTLISSLNPIDLAFSSFTGIDFSQVTSVEFAFAVPSNATDIEFKFLSIEDTTSVPEPVTILGTLLAGGIGVAMKKKKAALQESES
jgi:hypothetical protein